MKKNYSMALKPESAALLAIYRIPFVCCYGKQCRMRLYFWADDCDLNALQTASPYSIREEEHCDDFDGWDIIK